MSNDNLRVRESALNEEARTVSIRNDDKNQETHLFKKENGEFVLDIKREQYGTDRDFQTAAAAAKMFDNIRQQQNRK